MKIILASQSPQRKAMMETLDIPYEIMPADIDELAISATTHVERAAAVARAKGQKIAELMQKKSELAGSAEGFVILAADTYVEDPKTQRALEKPESLNEARDMLRYQSGKTLIEHTGVFWLQCVAGEMHEVSNTVSATITFRDVSDAEIERYITTEPVMTWSGAFCPAYPTGAALIAKIEGSFTGFTHGFPLEFFVPKLRAVGALQ